MELRRPTGKVSYPLILLAGVEGAGKTWAAAEATGIDWLGSSFFLEIGEQNADEYANVPGADYQIIVHDGTYRGILQAAQEAAALPAEPGQPNLLVVDSITNLWDLCADMAQDRANKRQRNRQGNQEAQITMDLWNWAKANFMAVVQALRSFPGVVIITARLENIASVENGKPSGGRIWKVRAQKDLPFDVQVEIQVREPRMFTLTKCQSTYLQLQPGGEMPLPDFSVEKLLTAMHATPEADIQERGNVAVQPGALTADEVRNAFVDAVLAKPKAEANRLVDAGDVEALREMWKIGSSAGRPDVCRIAADAANAAAQEAELQDRGQEPATTGDAPTRAEAIENIGDVLQGELVETVA